MTTFHDRLADLAEQAPSGGPPGELWATGVRLQRRRRLGTAVIVGAAVVALMLLAGLGLARMPEDAQPVAPRDGLGIPDRFYRWDGLPSTRETGPVGPLVAVVPEPGQAHGVLTNGEHVELVLPDAAISDDPLRDRFPAVSADGTMLAYWIGDGARVDGLGVWDAVTGDAYRFEVPSEYGLQVDLSTLLWTGDWVRFDVWRSSADGGFDGLPEKTVVWKPRTDDRVTRDRDVPYWTDYDNSAWGNYLVRQASGEVSRVAPDGKSEVIARFDPGERVLGPLHLDEAGSLAAGLRRVFNGEGADGQFPLVVLDVPGTESAGPVQVREVPGRVARNVQGVLGWRDDSHVVVLRTAKGSLRLLSVDVGTGEAEQLSVIDSSTPVLARDSLSAPVFEAPAPPPSAPSRGPLLAAGLGVCAIAVTAVFWWRRRALR